MVQFLQSQLESGADGGGLTEEGIESVEVAVQCLETAYGVSLAQNDLAVPKSLYQIFSEGVRGETETFMSSRTPQTESAPREATGEEKAEAEQLKNEGNQLMRDEKYTEALDCYTKAISKDCRNAVYYCNRAAAHSKLNNHREAIDDCKRALEIEPQYSKAYGRMGLAFSSLNDHRKAKECYQKALELEPDNESYRGNLSIAEEKLRSEPQAPPNPFAGLGGLGSLAGLGGPGGPDLSNLLNNPALMNMATQLMSDPNMQNMMSSFMGGMGGGMGPGMGPGMGGGAPGGAPAAAPPGPGAGGMEALLNAGRQLAEQMQSQNPELVEQIRRQMNRNAGGGDDQPGGNNQNPPQS